LCSRWKGFGCGSGKTDEGEGEDPELGRGGFRRHGCYSIAGRYESSRKEYVWPSCEAVWRSSLVLFPKYVIVGSCLRLLVAYTVQSHLIFAFYRSPNDTNSIIRLQYGISDSD
jgi:hypothetical protein